jgi:hypothetical protein
VNVTDEMLIAYVDGELSEPRRLLVESAVAGDPALFERLERHRRLRARMGGAFAGVLEEPVPERLVAAARTSNVVSLDGRHGALPWAAMAACLVAGVVAGVAMPRFGAEPLIGPDLTAQGELAGALDRQLASAPADGPVKIGLSFRSAEGYCRTFAQASVAGLACRQDEGWKVRMAVAREEGPDAEYRTAAAETPVEVLQAAQALMVGEPLDAPAEAKAAASGWR